ncbi:zinc-ribbon domain-containing protein [Clostridium chromiireducens]|uniref:Zinc-ribbon domain-containing protein n=1 Tax=Clostridium chromiireducens TaxID=225345 RepID=A0A964RMW2_9CLOT|nr:DUF5780 domain-containing protein [Clostridium chromiireducens]MVX64621.1 zinc-ribbon domain-containing protein [Clostridium chromiireducens]
MLCKKCGHENGDSSQFCNSCGTKLNKSERHCIQNLKDKIKGFDKRKKYIILASSIVVIIIIIGIILFTNPTFRFEMAIKTNSIGKATTVFNESIKGNKKYEDSANTFLKGEISNVEKEFKNESIAYDKAKNKLDNIKGLGVASLEVNDAIKEIDNLNDSRTAFNKAEDYLKEEDYVNAIKQYSNVIKEDKNYDNAQKEIENNKEKYKEKVLADAEENANNNEYDKAVSLLSETDAIIKNDNDITTKLDLYKQKLNEIREKEKQQKIKQAQSEQLLIVDSCAVSVQDTQWKALYPDMLQAFVTNKSDKTVKNMNVGFLAYDSNGYPLKIKTQFSYSGGNFEFTGNADNINLVSGAQFGAGVGWKLDEKHGISTIKACVKDATFYDGTTWNNPYYQYWIEQYKEKQLK